MGPDEQALDDFLVGRREHLLRSAYLLCGDRDEAEDLVQTVLVKVILGWRRLERIDNVEAYARRTLVNVFISSRRRMWRRERPHGHVPGVSTEADASADVGRRAD
jgi:DNA-directed RNA polymerase specialized sigma24 family protein